VDNTARHLVGDHKRQATEHLLLCDVVTAAKRDADPIGEPFVVGHRPLLLLATVGARPRVSR